uniref:Nose resistant to fluoxetine protein 6 n=1 Tax=Melanaphis sacchari TaxID=742174 RepID=A0A2H8TG17_9HEMI
MYLIINIMFNDKQCLIASWYISCDVQFFIIGVFIIYVYTKNNKYGIRLLATVVILSIFIPFIITILTKSEGILKIHIPFLENPRNSIDFNESYRASYMRATPFFTGLAMHFIVEKLIEKKIKFSLTTVYSSTLIVTVICLWIQYYGAIFYDRQRPYYVLEQALYLTFSHCTWTVISVWVTIFNYTSSYGFLEKIFNNRFIVPVGRLSYSVLLINLIVMAMSQGSQRSPNFLSFISLLDAGICGIFKTYLISLLLYFVVEAPFDDLTKRMIWGKNERKKSPLWKKVQNEKSTIEGSSNLGITNV